MKITSSLLLCLMLFVSNINAQNETTGTITKSKLLAWGRLDVTVENFNFDAQFTIVSYVATAIIAGFNYEILNKGPQFSEQTINLIKKLKRGQKIYFEDIKVKGPDGTIRVISPLVLKIM